MGDKPVDCAVLPYRMKESNLGSYARYYVVDIFGNIAHNFNNKLVAGNVVKWTYSKKECRDKINEMNAPFIKPQVSHLERHLARLREQGETPTTIAQYIHNCRKCQQELHPCP